MQRYLENLVENFPGTKDKHICIINFDAPGYAEVTVRQHQRITYYFIPEQRAAKYSDAYWRMLAPVCREILLQLGPTMLHINHYAFLEFGLQLKKAMGCKVLYTYHFFNWFGYFRGNYALFQALQARKYSREELSAMEIFKKCGALYRELDGLISICNHGRQDLAHTYGVDGRQIRTIYNGLRFDPGPARHNRKKLFRQKLGLPPGDRIVLYSGRINEDKGIMHLIDAIRTAYQQMGNVRLVVAGFDRLGILDSYLSEPWMTYIGEQKKPGLFDWYQAADVGVIPSLYDQCNFVAIEMMMYRLPIVASGIPGLREAFHNKRTGLLVNIDFHENNYELDPSKLAAAIIRLLTDPKLAGRMARNAYREYRKRFTGKRMAAETLRLYDQLMSKPGTCVLPSS
ncbi:glycosyltransferase [Chitinophaga rhizosphaerae]|uniref:glycosyltransferase n=1 Tax=Chitinophaga rhizosphaerae TaxID=1864947 RepID=UPI000F808642|nr:glycosyltransferase [Chitinophaga rhizosphaerae]